MLPCGHEAPEEKRPLTRGTVEDSRKTNRRRKPDPPTKSSRAVRVPPRAARCVSPHELFPWEYAVKRKPPPDPRHRYWMPEELFPSVVRSHRAVMRWRQPRSIHLCDEHGCVQLVDAGGETTRGRVPRGVSETFEVSPTGSIPRRENPAWQVANDKVEASRTMLPCGHEAPEEKRPLTRGTVEDSRKTNRRWKPDPPTKSSRAVRVPPRAARCVTLGPNGSP